MRKIIGIIIAILTFSVLFGAFQTSTTQAVGPTLLAQNSNLDLSPNSNGVNDLRALQCNCPTATSLRVLNGAQWGYGSGNYNSVTLETAQQANYGTSDFIPDEYSAYVIKTGSDQFYKLRVNGTNTSSGIYLEWDYLGSGLPNPPTANFTYSTYDITGFFTDTSSGNPSSRSWDFDDGDTITWQNPAHEFPSEGTYNVCLTSTNAGGSDTYCQNVTLVEVTSTFVSAGGKIDFDGDNVDDLELYVACGPNAMRTINGAEYTGMSGDYRDIDLDDLLGASYNSGQFCATSNNGAFIYQPYAVQTSSGSLVKYYTAENDNSGIRFVFEVMQAALPDPPVASFTSSSLDILSYFTDTSTNDPTEWAWTFGDGNTSNSQNPYHVYDSSGTYNVCLTATNVGGSSTQTCNNITITYVPSTTIAPNGTIDLNNDNVADLQALTCNCPSAISFKVLNFAQWGSASGNYDTIDANDAQNASYGTSNFVPSTATYYEPFLVRTGTDAYVKAWAIQNESNGIRIQFEVLIGGGETPDAPVASFTAIETGLSVAFTDTSTNTPTTWAWDFDDTATSTSRNPSHTYASNGTYNVCLTAANAGGSDQHCQNVTVTKPPTTDFDYSINGLEVTFTDSSTESPTSWAWDFADSNSSTAQNPVHNFTNGGTYNVCLTATNAGGSDQHCRSVTVYGPPTADFDFNVIGLDVTFTDNSASVPTSWSWTFGDTATSTQENPAHTYPDTGTFNVCLTASNAAGSDQICKDVSVIRLPTANFIFSISGTRVNFTDTSDASPTNWLWSFGDGGNSALQNPSHLFASTGVYNVCLTAGNAGGQGAQFCQDVNIVAPPTANFSSTSNGLNANFTDTSTGVLDSWSWVFGDGGTSTAQNPSHTFANTGTFNVCLTATNSGGSTQYCADIIISQPPVASFTYTRAGLTVNFTDTSSYDPTSWSWNFDDTNTSTQQNPSHAFANGGTYNVCLTVSNAVGDTQSCQNITVIQTPSNLATDMATYTSGPVNPIFSWNHDTNLTTWYQVWLQDPNSTITQHWYELGVTPGLNCTGGTCTATPAVDLTVNGQYTWYVQAYNAGNTNQGWSQVANFSLNVVAPPATTGLNITGDLVTLPAQPTYNWNHDNNTAWYQLLVTNSSGTVIDQQYEVGNTITCAGTCSITPATTLSLGDYSVWVRGWNSAGWGAWNTVAVTFHVGPTLPSAITGLSYTGSTTTVPAQLTYVWNHDANATWYNLMVIGPSGTVLDGWYEVGNTITCAGTCSITPTTTLGAGDYVVWVRGWNDAGNGAWNAAALNIHVGSVLPSAITGVNITGTLNVASAMPTYNWNHDANATWYNLMVIGPSGTVLDSWYEVGNTITCGGTCSITPATALSAGNYSVWVRGWNDAGNGAWNAVAGQFSTGLPAAVQPTGMNTVVNGGQPTFSWNFDTNATWYELYVSDANGTVILNTWYEVGSTITCAGTCSITPLGVLANGDYQWWVRGYNALGNGLWNDPAINFTVS